MVCDRCEDCYHRECLSQDQGHAIPNEGPWYCKACRSHIITHGHTDLIEDLPLLDLLFAGKTPAGAEDQERVERLTSICRAEGKELQVLVRTKHFTLQWVNVPPVPLRG